MKKTIAILAVLLGLANLVNPNTALAFELDYEKLVFLDAEYLAEQGILAAYEELKPELTKYVDKPKVVIEELDADTPSYRVTSQGETFDIYSPGMEEGQSWGRATYAFFRIVNRQLLDLDIKFYAINGGNDLGGLFLTTSQYHSAIKAIPQKTDWPYIPKLDHPWYGQPH